MPVHLEPDDEVLQLAAMLFKQQPLLEAVGPEDILEFGPRGQRLQETKGRWEVHGWQSRPCEGQSETGASMTESANLLKRDPGPELARLFDAGTQSFILSLVENAMPTDSAVILRSLRPGEEEAEESLVHLEWPNGVFSLSHVAIPFPASDPLYGDGSGEPSPGVRLGDLAARGERGVLRISPGDMLRIRWNPFYPFLERRVLEFTGLAAD